MVYISTTMEIWDTTEAKGEHWLIQLCNNSLGNFVFDVGADVQGAGLLFCFVGWDV